jgi:CspA family cold shock protein
MVDRDATGTVDFFNNTGGYGFIQTPAADEDVFFHMEDVGGPDLEEGQEVGFDIDWADKGPRATNLVRDPDNSGDSSGSGIVDDLKERVSPLFDSSDASGGEYDPTAYDAVGTVDFFNGTGGYGFVETDDAHDDVFFHMEDVSGPDLEEGQEVALNIEVAEKGPRATNVLRDPPSALQDAIQALEDAQSSTDESTAETIDDAPTTVYTSDDDGSTAANDDDPTTGTTDDSPTEVYTPNDGPTRVYTAADETTVECLECHTHLSEGDAMNFCPECGAELP